MTAAGAASATRRGPRLRFALVVVVLGGAVAWGSATQDSTSDAARRAERAAPELRRQPPRRSTRDAVSARRDALDALFQTGGFERRLDAVLDAVAHDTTPPEADPLWTHAVDAMAMTWIEHHAQLAQGRDRMLLETRPRARRLLATALAEAAEAELANYLSSDERHAVAADLIDVYFEPESEAFRSELLAGIEALSGGDVKLLLQVGVENVRRDRFGVLVRDDRAVEQAGRLLADGTGRIVPEDPEGD